MESFSVGQSLLERDKEVKELFNFVRDNAQEFEAYEIDKTIFTKLMKILSSRFLLSAGYSISIT